MIKTMDRHVGAEVLRKTMVAGFWLLCLYSFIAFLELLSEYGSDNDFGLIGKLYALSIPRQIYDLAPMILLLGTLLGMSTLARHSELIALQAGSISRHRIAATVMGLAAIIAVLVAVWGEFVVPTSEKKKDEILLQIESDFGKSNPITGTWVRDGQYYFRFSRINNDGMMSAVTLFEVSTNGGLAEKSVASSARVDDDRGALILNEVVRSIYFDGFTETDEIETTEIPVSVTTQTLQALGWTPVQMPTWELFNLSRFLRANGHNSDVLDVTFWNRLIIPITSVMMVACVIPFAFRGGRRGVSYSVFLGIVVGLGYFAIQQSIAYVVLLRGLLPILGATITLTIFAMGATYALAKLGKLRV